MNDRISQSRAASAAGINANTLRDWRRRGLIDDVGVQGETSRWTYSKQDIVHLALIHFLDVKAEMSLKKATLVAAHCAAHVLELLEGRPAPGYFHVGKGVGRFDVQVMLSDSAEHLAERGFLSVETFDLDVLAESLPSTLFIAWEDWDF